jgi:thymidylate synthase ThyX
MVQATDELLANAELLNLVAGWNGRVAAALVHDGRDLFVPSSLGAARSDQMAGTVTEQVIEVAGRTCYDSLGKGRPSGEYHGHLLDVRHWSVHEHPHHTFEIVVEGWLPDYLPSLINRPGVWTRMVPPNKLRVTLDPRCLLEWGMWSLESLEIDDPVKQFGMYLDPSGSGRPTNEVFRSTIALGLAMRMAVESLAPVIYRSAHARFPEWASGFEGAAFEELLHEARVESIAVVEPETPREEWITLYLTGSRGWSHELVRHGDWTAISQRSTRYVDESEGAWVLHPLVGAFLTDPHNGPNSTGPRHLVREACERVLLHARTSYDLLRGQLEAWLLPKLKAKGDPYAATSARKQARGAARGLLGNALETEVIFSASVAQWLHMLTMRAADAADAEIRLGFAMAALPQLRRSRYARRFEHIKLAPASDGLGMALAGGGAK